MLALCAGQNGLLEVMGSNTGKIEKRMALKISCALLLPSKRNVLQPSLSRSSSLLPSPGAAFFSARKFLLVRKCGGNTITNRQSLSSTCATMAAADTTSEEDVPRIGVLFVCLGNICRSPTAEAVFRYAVEKEGLKSQFNIDSAGTINYHEGDPADSRMKAAASKRGVELTSISRPIRPSDFEEFDIILAMDKQNKEDILKAHKQWSTIQELPPNSEKKVKLMCEYCKKFNITEVPDPYYGGAAGFEKVLDLLEDACEYLLDSLVSSMPNKASKEL